VVVPEPVVRVVNRDVVVLDLLVLLTHTVEGGCRHRRRRTWDWVVASIGSTGEATPRSRN
jgi:hypothetical protein